MARTTAAYEHSIVPIRCLNNLYENSMIMVIEWRKDGKTITYSGRIYEWSNLTLLINLATQDDSGLYRCYYRHQDQSLSYNDIRLIVGGKLYI